MRIACRQQKARRWQRKLITLAVAAALGNELASGAPTAPVVVNGQASFAQQGKTLSITNTPGAIINWKSFSIAQGETTRFIQQSAASTVLNRVTGVDPSQILGTLQSNGRVFLINPNGIVFGAGAQVDVAGLVASSLNLSNADFLAGRLRFADTPGAGNIANQGAIKASGGPVYIIAPNVENSGTITTVGGDIILAAGKTVQLVDPQSPDVRIEVSAPANQALNLGQLMAERGHVGIYAGMIRNSGKISASGASLNEKGEVVLVAKKDVILDKTSVISANGPAGGTVSIQAQEGKATINGTVEANGTQGKGGAIGIAGQQGVSVEPTARITANGTDGGRVSITSSAGSVSIAAPVTANAASGRAGQIAINAATTITLATGAQLSASGGQGGGAITIKGSTGVTFDTNSTIQANGLAGGTVSVQADAGTVSAHGTIEVTGIEDNGGSVSIAALSDITLDITSRILANGRAGGEMRMESSEGTLQVSGLLDGTGRNGPGGTIYLLAPRVALLRRAVVDVAGETGGGTILVGGDYQGKNPDVQNALRTYVDADATIRADAITSGDGGKVIVWANNVTRFYGTISARGGSQDGNGGLVETSGKNYLDFRGTVDTRAPHGATGTLLLDPTDINIVAAGTATPDTVLTGQLFQDTAAIAISEVTIAALTAALTTNDVTISTNNAAGTGTGNINWVSGANLNYNGLGTRTLTLNANNNITLSGNITDSVAGGDVLNLVLNLGGAGTIIIAGQINNMGGALALNGPTTLSGTIANAILTTSTGSLSSSSGTLDGVTLGSSMTESGTLFVNNTLTLADAVTLNIGASQLRFNTAPGGIATSGTSATLQMANGTIYEAAGGTATIGAGVTVQGYGTISWCCVGGSPTLVNNGTIDANVAGQTLTINPTTFTNGGSLKASAGILTVSPTSWSSTGTLVASGGTLNLGGTFTRSDLLGGITHSAGAINVTGTLDLQNGIVDMGTGGTFGVLGLTGVSGTIKSGTLNNTGGLTLSSNSGILDGVTLGNSMTESGTLFVNNTLTLADAVTLNIGASQLRFNTAPGGIATSGTSATLQMANGTIYEAAGGTATIGAGVTVQGYGTISWCCVGGNPTLVNNGTIDANVAGQTLTINPTTFTNGGSLKASAGILTVSPTSWSSTGTLVASGGTLNLGGTFTRSDLLGGITHSAGAINVTGTLDLQNGIVDMGTGGTFGVLGLTGVSGTIKSGTLNNTGGLTLSSNSGILDGVTLGNSMTESGTLFVNNTLTLADAVTLNIGASQLRFNTAPGGIATSGTSATLQMANGTIYEAAGGTATIGAGVTVQGYGTISWCCVGGNPTLVNNGTIDANVAGQTLTINPTTFTNGGSLKASAGILTVSPTSWSSTGTLVASGGTLNLGGTFTRSDLLGGITHSAGAINVTGTLDLQNGIVDMGTGGTFGVLGLTGVSGTIKSGTLNNTGGLTLSSNSGILDGVTLGNSMTESGTLFVNNTLTLADAVTLNIGASQLRFNTAPGGIATSGTSATLQMANGTIYEAAGGTATIGAGVTVQGYGTISWCCVGGNPTLVNNGTIDANVAGQTLNINPVTFNNNGTLQAGAGTVNIAPTTFNQNGSILVSGAAVTINPGAATNWANGGSISVSSGTLNLGGAATYNGLFTSGTFSRTGGVLNLTGTLDLGGASINIDSGGTFGTGGLGTLSGTLKNGTVTGTTLSSSSGTLDGITLGSSMTESGTLFVNNTLTLADAVTLNIGSSQMQFKTATGGIVASGTSATLQMANGTLYEAAGGTATVGAGVTVQGYGTISWCCVGGSPTVVNNGTIDANVAGQTLNISPVIFTNNGAVQASAGTMTISPTTLNSAGAIRTTGGTLTISPANAWTNGPGSSITESSGTLNLGSSFTLAGLLSSGGTFSRTGGVLNLPGTLDLGGASINIDSGGTFGTGGLGTLSGTLKNGTVTGTTLSSSSGTLDGITLGSSMTESGTLFVNNTLTLADAVTLNIGSSQMQFKTATGGIVASGTSATLQMANGTLYEAAGGTATVGAGVTVQGYGTISWCCVGGSPTVVNNGTIDANVAGQTLNISPVIFTNNGAVQASAGTMTISPTTLNSAGAIRTTGGTLTISPANAWTNGPGSSITESSGTLNLGSSFTLAGLLSSGGTFSRTGGVLNLPGTLDLGGASINIDSGGTFGTGGLGTLSGTLKNGTVTGTTLSSSSGTLDGITLGSSMTESGTLFVNNTLTLADAVTLNIGSSQMQFKTATGGIVASGTSATLQMANGTLYEAAGGTATVGAGVTVQGYGTISWCCVGGSPTVVNNGTIDANVAGQTLNISPVIFTNNGAVQASAGTMTISPTTLNSAGAIRTTGGTLTISPANAWTNGPGSSITESSGTLNLGSSFTLAGLLSSGGTFSRTGGVLNLPGTLDLGGASINIDSGGTFGTGGLGTLSGTLKNGTVTGTTLSSSSGTLDGITLGSSMTESGTLFVNNTLTLADAVTLNIGSSQMQFKTATGGIVASGTSATLQMANGTLYEAAGGTATVGAGVTVQGYGTISWCCVGGSPTVVNNGTIDANVAGQTLNISPVIFTNNGTIRATAGTLSLAPSSSTTSWNNAGTLQVSAGATINTNNRNLLNDGIVGGSGTIVLGAGHALTNNATGIIKPGASPGFLTITGDLTLTAGSTTEFEMNGFTRGANPGYDSVHATGNVAINTGAIAKVTYLSPFTTTGTNVGDTFLAITAGGTVTGLFNTIIPPTGPGGPEAFVTQTVGNTVFLQRGTTFTGVNVWNTDSSGNWSVASNWSAGLPVAGQIVIIDRGPVNPTVTVNTAGQLAGQLQNSETLTIAASGTLTLDGVSTSSGTINITGGTLTANNSLTANIINLSGGTLAGTSVVTSTGLFTWTGGTMTGTGTTQADGGLVMSGDGLKDITVRTLNNTGTATWTNATANNGRIRTGSGVVINNSGTWLDQSVAANAISNDFGGAASTFNNTGTYQKSVGAAATNIAIPFNNTSSGAGTGVAAVQSGLLNLSGGGTGNTGSQITGAAGTTVQFGSGTYTLNAGSVLNAPSIVFSGGIANLGGDYTAGTSTTVNGGTANFTGNLINTPSSLSVGSGTANFSSAAGVTFSTVNFSGGTIAGTQTLTSTGLFTWTGGTMTGTGTTQADGGLVMSGDGLKDITVRTLNNTGTATWTNATANNGRIRTGSGVVINNSGTWLDQSVAANAISNDFGGAASTFNNTGTYQKSVGAAATNIAIPFNNTSSGAGTGVAAVQSGLLNLSGGGTGNTGSQITGAAGTTVQFGSGTYTLNAGSVLNAPSIVFSGGIANLGGDYTAGTSTTVNGGTANFTGNLINTPSSLSVGSGTANFSSAAGVTFSTVNFSGGTIAGTQTLTSTGLFTWTGGTMTGTGTTQADGGLVMSGDGLKDITVRTLNNTGTATWTNTTANNGRIRTGSGVVINNSGTWLDQSVAANAISNDFGGAASTFNNTGTYQKSGAATTTIAIPFNNTSSGIVNVQSGTLTLSSFPTNAGTLNIASGATLSTNANALTNASTGVIAGNGTLNLGGAGKVLTNGGTLSPGASPGTLTITGDLTMTATSITSIEIQSPGITAGTDYDLIAVSGAANLNGTLNVTHLGGFTPSVGNIFQIMTYASRTGDFVTKNFPAGFSYVGTLNALNYTLSLLGGATNTWLFDGSDSWLNTARWSLGHTPTALEDVVIPDYSTLFTVSIPSGAQVAKSIVVQGNDIFAVSGGSFTFTSPSTINNGTLAIAGGTVTANAGLGVKTFDLSSGALNGSGSLTVTNAFSQTGGAINIGGAASITQAAGNLALGTITANSILASAAGNLSVGGALTSTAGGNSIVLSATGDFSNTAGASALTPGAGGRWLVYSASPATVAKGGLTSNFRHYGATAANYAPGSVTESGDGFIYASAAGSLTVATTLASGTASNTYGSAPTATYGFTLSGFVDSEDNATNIGLAGSAVFTPTIASATNAGGYTVNYASGLSSVAGYGFTAGTGLAYTVNPATVTLTGTRTYDGTASFAGSAFGTINTGIGAETLTVSGSGSVLSTHVAAGTQALTSGSLTLVSGTGLASNYVIAGGGNTGTITAAALTAGLTNTGVTKPYDGTSAAPGGFAPTYSFSGLVAGDTAATLTNTGSTFNNAHVAGASFITTSGLVISGVTGINSSAAGDYALTATAASSSAGSASIAALALTPTAPVIGGTLTKTYDGTSAATGATLTGGAVVGAIAGDTLVLNTSGVTLAYNGFHVIGTNAISATGSVGYTINSSTAGSALTDYSFTAPAISSVAASITAKTLTPTASAIGGTLTKAYDGTNAATGATLTGGSISGAIAGDTLVLDTSAVTLAYNGIHVLGTNAIAATGGVGYTISSSTVGSATTDYSFIAPPISNAAASITAKALTATAPVIGGTLTKTYDGTNAATGAMLTGGLIMIADAIAGDTLTLDTSAVTLAYNGFHVVGTNAINATGGVGYTITGSTAGSVSTDYNFTAPVIANASASITAAPLTVTAPVIGGTTSKTYDGTNAATGATLTGGTISGAIAGDTLALNTSGVTLTYNGFHVVATNAITATGSAGLTVASSTAGSVATDYTFATPAIASVAASITAQTLTVTAPVIGGATSKTYDGTNIATGATLTGGTVGGAIAGDTLAFNTSAVTLAYNGINVGGANAINASGGLAYTISGSTAGSATTDYSFTAPTIASVTASITPASLVYVATPVSAISGGAQPSFTGTVSGVASIDTLAGVTTGTIAFTSTATTNSPVGSYAVDGSGLTVISSNYNSLISQAPANATAFTIDIASIAAAPPLVQQVVGQNFAAINQVTTPPTFSQPPPAPPATEPVSNPNAPASALMAEEIASANSSEQQIAGSDGTKSGMRRVPVCR